MILASSGSKCWPDTMEPLGGAMDQLLPNAPPRICFLWCCTPFWKKREGRMDEFCQILRYCFKARPTGKIPGSSVGHPRHKHDAPGAKSFHPLNCSSLTYACPSAQEPLCPFSGPGPPALVPCLPVHL